MNSTSQHFRSDWSELSEPQTLLDDTTENTLAIKNPIYYRSKAFVSQVNINPLVAASAPLFFLIEKIKALENEPDLDKLHQDIQHEIIAFEHQAQAQGYHSKLILAARYGLCLWIDETVFNTSWGANSNWREKMLVDPATQPHKNPFFALMNRCLHDTATYIDLLELFYLCLSFGFEGEYRYAEKGQMQLIEIRNYLFERVSQQRGDFSKRLEIIAEQNEPITIVTDNIKGRIVISIIIFAAVVTGYILLNQQLNQQLQPISHVLKSIL